MEWSRHSVVRPRLRRIGDFWRNEFLPAILDSRFVRQLTVAATIFVLFSAAKSLPAPWGSRVVEGAHMLVTRDYDFGLMSRRVSSLQVFREDLGLTWPFSRGQEETVPEGPQGGSPEGPQEGSQGGLNGSTLPEIAIEQKALLEELTVPVQGKVLSGFGWRTGADGSQSFHEGVDLQAALGAGVRAAADGVVGSVGNDPDGYGKYIILDHGAGVSTVYAHAADIFVTEGSNVSRGDVIASAGQTGNAQGPQVHFEVRVDGKAVDPGAWLSFDGGLQ